MKGMNLGAIIIIDALGFKGIWAREDVGAVLSRMKSLRRDALKLQGADKNGVLMSDSGLRHRVRCMSDTIVITVSIREAKTPERALYKAMHAATLIAASIMRRAISEKPPLLFRGCLAVGYMKEEVDFLIGPAVDEAAELCEIADGPFLWMAPSALTISKLYAETFAEHLDPWFMLPYKVPLKKRKGFDTYAYNYLGMLASKQTRDDICKQVISAFGSGELRADVETKKNNIIRFLRFVEKFASNKKWETFNRPYRKPTLEELSPSQRTRRLFHEWEKS